jgi:O-antigen/teichoic acid export membrane protein
MWAMPFGAGLALFAHDLVGPLFGDEWQPAAGLLAAIGLTCGFAQIAFNWTVFLRALDWTTPIFVSSVANLVTFAVVSVPAILALGLTGYAIGVAAMTLVQIVLRWYYMRRLFAGFGIFRHLARAVAPTVPPAAFVLLMRVLEGGDRPAERVIAEAAIYGAGVVACTIVFERELLTEAIGYLRGKRTATAAAAA